MKEFLMKRSSAIILFLILSISLILQGCGREEVFQKALYERWIVYPQHLDKLVQCVGVYVRLCRDRGSLARYTRRGRNLESVHGCIVFRKGHCIP